jgi:site-specific recombinase XerD
MKVSFNLKKGSVSHQQLIVMICRWDNNRPKFSIGESVAPEFWDAARQRVKEVKQCPEAVSINSLMDHMQVTYSTKFRKFMVENDRMPSVNEFRALVSGKKVAQIKSPIEFFQQFHDRSLTRVNPVNGKRLSENTLKKYRTIIARLKEFDVEYPLSWKCFDAQFYTRYLHFLTATYSKNTVGKYITVLKTFLREAESCGMPVNPYYKGSGFRSFSEPSTRIHLSPEDLEKLFWADIQDPKLSELRDVFLVSCYSGLRFSDWYQLPQTLNKFPGQIALSRQMKTGTPALVPIHENIREICDRLATGFKHNSRLVNQVVNRDLKKIGEIAGITELVNQEITRKGMVETSSHRKCDLIMTHTGRRTFATNTYMSGFDTKALSVIMGMSTEKELVKYLKVSDNTRSHMLDEHWKSLKADVPHQIN